MDVGEHGYNYECFHENSIGFEVDKPSKILIKISMSFSNNYVLLEYPTNSNV